MLDLMHIGRNQAPNIVSIENINNDSFCVVSTKRRLINCSFLGIQE